MSRSGYTYDDTYDDNPNWELIKWRGQVASATRGKRGQRLLRELAEAMDAMPVKVLIAHELEKDGCHCALGVVGKARGLDLSAIAPEDTAYNHSQVPKAFGIAHQLAQEIVFMNDEDEPRETPEQRWVRMRAWVESQIVKEAE